MNTHSSGQGRGWTNRYLPQLEGLESRCCPTTVKLVGHTLLILGDQHDNTVLISDDGQGEVTVTYDIQTGNASASNGNGSDSNGNGSDSNGFNGGGGAQLEIGEDTFTGVERIVVRTFGGDDLVDYVLEAELAENRALLVDTGKDDDIVNLDFAAGVSGERLNVDLLTGKGDDLALADFGTIAGTDLRFRAHLGKGDDDLDLTVSGDVTGDARVRLDVDAGKGDDGVDVDVSGNIEADALVDLKIKGDKGEDNLTVAFDGDVAGEIKVKADGGHDDDTFDVSLAGALTDDAQARFELDGGHGQDIFDFNADAVDIATAARLSLDVKGGHGDDDVAVAWSGLLEGALDVKVDGGHGDDTIAADLELDVGSTGDVKARVLGGKGDDDLTLNVVVDAADTAVVDALLDGGKGTDTCVATANVVVKNCEA